MNAFIRQEISAVHLTRQGKGQPWKPGQTLAESPSTTYLPIVDARLHHIVGYQAAAETASGAFECVRRQLMHGPQSGLLLVELDAAACMKSGRCHTHHLCSLFSHEAWTERELVIHLRYGHDDSAWPAMQMQKRLQAGGIGFAVSWDGCPNLLSLNALIDARLIRFEASALETDNKTQASAVAEVLNLAQALGIQTMLAEVGDGEQVEAARRLGIDWLQGPLFNRMKVLSTA
jgi:hypothetical protein